MWKGQVRFARHTQTRSRRLTALQTVVPQPNSVQSMRWIARVVAKKQAYASPHHCTTRLAIASASTASAVASSPPMEAVA